ncbi:MAG TPA: UDP-N-acetylglucosamine 2-epimerase (hydrolyzing) [Bacilli bacterium]|nr:UDP-N-acetylglucosamine 2-epimerase (hydrolyzing) [Bacilli bacterium]
MSRRKICVVTGTRAEYGLLYWLMKEVQADNDLELQIVVTGMHLSPEFGLTYKTIEEDGFQIDEKVEMLLSSDTPVGIAKSIGLGTIGFAGAFERLKPDIVVLLGDRFEILAAAQTALVLKIPIAHLHGGELTAGAFDEAIRHSITKMSHLHFAASESYRNRIIQLGENPRTVYNVGSPGLDHITRMKLVTDKKEFEELIGFKLGNRSFLITYHPVTLSNKKIESSLNELLDAIDEFPDANIIFTKANADNEGRKINKMLEEYVQKNKGRAKLFTSLGQLRYLSAILHVDIVIGNSSSGLHEVPSFKKPTVNIGERQKGRLRAKSVIDCSEEKEEITNAIKLALSSKFQASLAYVQSPYGEGNASIKIKEVLKKVDLSSILMKSFYDMEMN